jgi:phytoene synthase
VNAESAAAASARLRELDRDRYFATLVLPAAARPAITALYAFNAEIAAIPDRVHEPMPGEIRLQWWKDALQGDGHGEVRQNPLADALLTAVAEFALPTAPLIRLLEARRFDLYHDPMPDLASFEGYAGETVSVLYQLAAMALNRGAEIETGDAAGHLGVAQALVGHLRAFGYHAARGRIFLPWAVLAANGVLEADVLAGRPGESLLAARRQLAELAREHLAQASAAAGRLPRPLRSVFAPIALLAAQLKRADVTAERTFSAPPDLADWQKLAILALRGWHID